GRGTVIVAGRSTRSLDGARRTGAPDMKHAGPEALAMLGPVLAGIREYGALVEKSPGSFYLRSKAFLHFHEDPTGLFADVKEDLVSFKRYRVSTRAEQREFLTLVSRCLSGVSVGVSA